jgi:hypothetical protein
LSDEGVKSGARVVAWIVADRELWDPYVQAVAGRDKNVAGAEYVKTFSELRKALSQDRLIVAALYIVINAELGQVRLGKETQTLTKLARWTGLMTKVSDEVIFEGPSSCGMPTDAQRFATHLGAGLGHARWRTAVETKRSMSYGDDGPIPAKHIKRLDRARDLAYEMACRQPFAKLFADLVSSLGGGKLELDACVNALDKMRVNLADTTRQPDIIAVRDYEDEKHRKDGIYPVSGGYSFQNGNRIWIRESELRKKATVVASTLLHESAHLAGAEGASWPN